MIFEKFQIKVSRAGASKNKEREMGRARRAVKLFGTLIWILNFPPEGTQRRTGRCTPPPTNNDNATAQQYL
jgi:hypothetical protein